MIYRNDRLRARGYLCEATRAPMKSPPDSPLSPLPSLYLPRSRRLPSSIHRASLEFSFRASFKKESSSWKNKPRSITERRLDCEDLRFEATRNKLSRVRIRRRRSEDREERGLGQSWIPFRRKNGNSNDASRASLNSIASISRMLCARKIVRRWRGFSRGEKGKEKEKKKQFRMDSEKNRRRKNSPL